MLSDLSYEMLWPILWFLPPHPVCILKTHFTMEILMMQCEIKISLCSSSHHWWNQKVPLCNTQTNTRGNPPDAGQIDYSAFFIDHTFLNHKVNENKILIQYQINFFICLQKHNVYKGNNNNNKKHCVSMVRNKVFNLAQTLKVLYHIIILTTYDLA